jgi:hypothetical protein
MAAVKPLILISFSDEIVDNFPLLVDEFVNNSPLLADEAVDNFHSFTHSHFFNPFAQ